MKGSSVWYLSEFYFDWRFIMSNKEIKLGIVTTYGIYGADLLAGILFTPFLITSLGQSEYGVYSLMGAFVGSLAVLDFGFGNAITRYVSQYITEKDKNKESNLIAMCIILYGIIGIICLGIGLMLIPFLDNIFGSSLTNEELSIAKTIYFISLSSMSISFLLGSFNSYIQAYEKFTFINSIIFIRLIIRICSLSILLLLGFKAITVVMIDALLNLSTGLVFILYSLKKLKMRIKLIKFDLDFLKELSGYSFFVFLSNIADLFFWRIGLLILGGSNGAAAVAIYSVGITLVSYFQYFSGVINGKLFPHITQMVTRGASSIELTKFCIRVSRVQLFLLGGILFGFFLFGTEFILLWLGSEYKLSFWVSFILMAAMLPQLIQYSCVMILRAKKKDQVRTILQLFALVLGVLFGWMLNIIHEVIGMALGVGIAVVFLNWIVVNFLYVKFFDFNIFIFLKELIKLIPSFIIAIVLSLPLYFWSSLSWEALIIKCSLYTIIYVCIFWLIGANPSEKELFKSLIKKGNIKILKKRTA